VSTAPTTRLAPSPTGALHLGNARTFLINWALARQNGWSIVLRIEDLDTPRIKPGVIDLTVDLLAWLGIDWDSGPLIQSDEPLPHVEAMEALAAKGLIYPCDLTRTQIEAAASAPQEGAHDVPFPASLRPARFPTRFTDDQPSWRLAVADQAITFTDLFCGPQSHNPATTVGDFVVWTRRDPAKRGQPAYQLAVVVDDARQGITHIVRGDDLLDSAARQILLYRALGVATQPRYLHLPLIKGSDGRRLAKRHGDTRLDTYRANGVSPERIIGLVAHWCGIGTLEVGSPPSDAGRTPGAMPGAMPGATMSPSEFRERLDLDKIPAHPITFTPESDSWLLNRG